MFIQSMKAKLKPTDFQDDWLSNDLADVKEIQEEDNAKKFENLKAIEKVMDSALFDTQASLSNLEKQDFGLKKLIQEI